MRAPTHTLYNFQTPQNLGLPLFQLYYWIPVWSWGNRLNPLCFRFLIYKVGTKTAQLQRVTERVKGLPTCARTLRTGPGTSKHHLDVSYCCGDCWELELMARWQWLILPSWVVPVCRGISQQKDRITCWFQNCYSPPGADTLTVRTGMPRDLSNMVEGRSAGVCWHRMDWKEILRSWLG